MLKLLRPSQWVKNFFIFLPLFFSGKLADLPMLFESIITFFIFSLIASIIYCFNDIVDVEQDKLHPQKKNRPIASGKVTIVQAFFLMFVLLIIAILLVFSLNKEIRGSVSIVIGVYMLLNVLYTLKLKNRPIIDVFIIATGFVLRVIVGGVSTDIVLSHWIVLMTFLLALLLGFAKRRDDVVLFEKTGKMVRKNTLYYNKAFINQSMSIIGAVTIVCYIMYTLSEEVVERLHSSYLYITSVFVLAGIIRYLQITLVEEKSGSPTKVLLKDGFIEICLLCWIVSFVIILYI